MLSSLNVLHVTTTRKQDIENFINQLCGEHVRQKHILNRIVSSVRSFMQVYLQIKYQQYVYRRPLRAIYEDYIHLWV